YTKRAYSPLLITYNNKKNRITLVNDTFKVISGMLSASTIVLPRNVNHKKTVEVSIEENSTKMLTIPIDVHSEDNIIIMDFNSDIGNLRNYFFLSDPINLKFDEPKLKYAINADEKTITFLSDVFTFLVSISWRLRPHDNYFNLLPNEPYTVKVDNLPEGNTNSYCSWVDNRIS
ncbi:MAG: hypothetical protein ACW98F_14255, partial [Candidatus Hodarchaeales archaeon]